MKYALINDQPQEAHPNLCGECRCCGNPTIAKCGKVKVWHWAHKGMRMCDSWWENETEWHRTWKNQFPKECQEVIQYADDGEKHIADVKTKQGYVIEFQHSFIKPEESNAREIFYKKMIWIVDGCRRKRDKETFIDVWNWSKPVDSNEWIRRYQCHINKCVLIRDWLESKVPVIFDFSEDTLFALLPKTKEERVYIVEVIRDTLIASLNQTTQVNSFAVLTKNWTNLVEKDERYLRWQKINSLPPFLRSFHPRIT